MKNHPLRYALVIAAASAASWSDTHAGLTFELQETGGNLTLTLLSGSSANITGLSSASPGSGVLPSNSGVFSLGAASVGSGNYLNYTTTFTGSSFSFGPSPGFNTGTTSGSFVGFELSNNLLSVPNGYISGNPLGGWSTTWAGKTLADVALVGGTTLAWTFNSGANADTITFNVMGGSPVPESSGSAAGIGLALAGLHQLSRRRQARARE